MNLNISELENNSRIANPYENFDYNTYQENGYNYWETQTNQDNNNNNNNNKQLKPKKKRVSFDDILKNMNVVVNNQGVLQYMLPKKETFEESQSYDPYNYNPYQEPLPQYQQPLPQQYQQPLPQQYQQPLPQQYQRPLPQQHQRPLPQQYQKPIQVHKQPVQEPIDPSVKHSYIYNKYFSDYIDTNATQEEEVRVPKTKEEYFQMLLDDKIKAEEQRRRIEQMKPRTMLFSSGGYSNSQHPRPSIKPSVNNLRKMNFM